MCQILWGGRGERKNGREKERQRMNERERERERKLLGRLILKLS